MLHYPEHAKTIKVTLAPEAAQWLTEAAQKPQSDFYRSLFTQYTTKGGLTQKQVECVLRGMQPNPAAINVGTNGTDKLEKAFAKAKESGSKKPRLIIDGLAFKPAPLSGKNPNAIYITDRSTKDYLGKVANGLFSPIKQCPPLVAKEIAAICADPFGYAVAYGLKSGECSCCGRPLSDPKSIAAGIGPVCAKKWGW